VRRARLGPMERVRRAHASTWFVTAAAVLAVAYSWIAGGFRPFTQPMNIAVAVPVLAVVVLVGLRPRASVSSGGTGRGAVIWVVLFATLAAWELTAYLSSPRHDHPTLSSIADTIMSTHAGRAAMFLAWLALGGALAFRPRRSETGAVR
jgi:hypothetical protein